MHHNIITQILRRFTLHAEIPFQPCFMAFQAKKKDPRGSAVPQAACPRGSVFFNA